MTFILKKRSRYWKTSVLPTFKSVGGEFGTRSLRPQRDIQKAKKTNSWAHFYM